MNSQTNYAQSSVCILWIVLDLLAKKSRALTWADVERRKQIELGIMNSSKGRISWRALEYDNQYSVPFSRHHPPPPIPKASIFYGFDKLMCHAFLGFNLLEHFSKRLNLNIHQVKPFADLSSLCVCLRTFVIFLNSKCTRTHCQGKPRTER